MCDYCNSRYHTKCVGMSNTEYGALGTPSARWQCIRCLIPVPTTDQTMDETLGNTQCKIGQLQYMFPKLKRSFRVALLDINRSYNKLVSL